LKDETLEMLTVVSAKIGKRVIALEMYIRRKIPEIKDEL
jgi:hypothetical protein